MALRGADGNIKEHGSWLLDVAHECHAILTERGGVRYLGYVNHEIGGAIYPTKSYTAMAQASQNVQHRVHIRAIHISNVNT